MGGVAIWSMHFIGNRAIDLGAAEHLPKIVYSPKFTVASLFLPIIIMIFAFWAMGSDEKVSMLRVALGGFLAGLGICGMHYLGQEGISNYECEYVIGGVVGAAIISVVACIAALGVFFVWRSTWDTSWWRRALCAIVLSGAVSGMHWLASICTRYRLITFDANLDAKKSENELIAITIALVSWINYCTNAI
jgi:NO-binding membrane sensor protein with MHYT domain